ncbi:MAG: hypothetical protein ACOC2D_15575 [Spirochaetota bacterium]
MSSYRPAERRRNHALLVAEGVLFTVGLVLTGAGAIAAIRLSPAGPASPVSGASATAPE